MRVKTDRYVQANTPLALMATYIQMAFLVKALQFKTLLERGQKRSTTEQIKRRALTLMVLFCLAIPAHAQLAPKRRIVIDHNSVALFDQIPGQYKAAATALRMGFADKSVGGNISDGLTCLEKAVDDPTLANSCKSAETWPGTWPRTNWAYHWFPGQPGTPNQIPCTSYQGTWQTMGRCFADWLITDPNFYSVWSYGYTYLEMMAGSTIDNQFFAAQPGNVYDWHDYKALIDFYPNIRLAWWTSSLATVIGTPDSQSFNQQMRTNLPTDGILFDLADIESHDPNGMPCTNASGLAVICKPPYTVEANGGHLTPLGKVRVAKAMWVLMAQLAGWVPGGEPPPPPPPTDTTPPVVNLVCTNTPPGSFNYNCNANATDNVHVDRVIWQVTATAVDDAGNMATDTENYTNDLP